MRRTLLICLFVFSVALTGCSEAAEEPHNGRIAQIYFSRDLFNLSPETAVEQFEVGAQGGDLTFYVYYPKRFKDFPMYDYLSVPGDYEEFFTIAERTQMTDMLTRYTLRIKENTTGNPLGFRLDVFDKSGFKDVPQKYGYGCALLIVKPE